MQNKCTNFRVLRASSSTNVFSWSIYIGTARRITKLNIASIELFKEGKHYMIYRILKLIFSKKKKKDFTEGLSDFNIIWKEFVKIVVCVFCIK